MSTFVLVHGGWRGGWTYRRTVDLLRGLGHTVFAPSLAGSGEHHHLLSGDISLSTHITDIVHLIEFEDLTSVVLVGHSYGGMVITGVADRVPDRIRELVYLDAVVPTDGQSFLDVYPVMTESFLGAAADNKGLYVDPMPSALFGDNEADQAYIDQRCTPFPLRGATEKLTLSNNVDLTRFRRTYVLAEGWDPNPYRDNRERLADDPSWDFFSVDCGHDIMMNEPQFLVDTLLRTN
ncbi:alpha/beta hydrolase [Streptomyces sp. SRF1]|uniref:alpha/beta hydrolase n=1 Tax=Streptomyces sp. SRF1 TaxID=1549642 RepID=UPI0025B0A197|nr:alpha/beta hydrolase [Streptomyces sp. SRF1]MDN3059774.1 alpha/beta hydrolase [Streptomyces sp. SRF1]